LNESRDDGVATASAEPYIICTLLKTKDYASTSSLNFYWLDALLDAQLTVSKH